MAGALLVGGRERAADLRELQRGRAALLLGLAPLRGHHGGLAREPRLLLVGGGELVADGHQLLFLAVDALRERACLQSGFLGPREQSLRLLAQREERRLDELL